MAFKMHHTGFTVSDMDKSIAFYRDLLGLKLIQDVVRENLPAYDEILGFPNVKLRVALFHDETEHHMLELVEYITPRRETRELRNTYVGAGHISLVVDDLDAEYKRLQSQGVRFNSPPVDVVRDGKYICKSLYMFDPDGMSVELYEPAKG